MYILLVLDEAVYRDSVDRWCSWILLYPTACCWIFPFLRGVCGSLPHNSGFFYFSQLSFCLA